MMEGVTKMGGRSTSKELSVDQAGRLNIAGAVQQAIPDYTSIPDLLAAFGNFSDVMPGDFVTVTKFSNGQTVTALSAGPLTPGESRVTLDVPVMQPCALEVEASVVRNRQQFATLALYENGPNGPDPVPDPINIISIYQCSGDFGISYNATAGAVCTVVLETALPLPGQPGAVYLSDWVHVAGMVDTRLNYQNCAVKFISGDRKTITFGVSDEATLPSLAVAPIAPPAGSAKLHFYNNMGGASDGFGIRFTGGTATSAALVSVFADGDAQISGSLVGDHRITIGSTAPVYVGGTTGNVELKATSRYRLEARPSECAFLDKGVDNVGVPWTARGVRTAVKPSLQSRLRSRFRVYQPEGMSRPVAKIVSISKSGSTTATVTHDGGYTFQTGQYVTIKGVADQTNFGASATPVALTVTGPTTFTITHGSAVTATSSGGSIILCNGGVDQPGVIVQTVVNAFMSSASGRLDLTGSTTWSGLVIGDYVNLHGVIATADGSLVGVDGAWEVFSVSTNLLVLRPVIDVFGNRVSPDVASLASTPCGGTVILRTTARVHDILLEEWSESRTMIDGQGTSRVDKSLPVSVVTTASVQGSTAVDSVMPNPVAIGGRASSSNLTAMSASGDLVAMLMTMIGVPVVRPFSLPEADWSFTTALTTNADTVIQTAGGMGIKRYLTALQVQNTHASVATTLAIKDGTTTRHTIYLPASMSVPVDIEFPTPLQTSANATLQVACGTTGANVLFNAQGYTAP